MHIDMSGDKRPDLLEHSNRGITIFACAPHLNMCGDPEVMEALKCECGTTLQHDECSLNQVTLQFT